MQHIAEVALKIQTPPPEVSTGAPAAAPATPTKPLHLLSDAELEAAIAACPRCGGMGYIHPGEVPITNSQFGKLLPCPECTRYAAALRAMRELQKLRPIIERYSMLKGELLAKSFDNFDTEHARDANHAVHEWAVAIWRGNLSVPWLYLWGAPGNGKTHLVAAAANGLSVAHIPVVFTTFTEMCGMAAQNDFRDKEDVIQALQKVPVLIIDDITEQEMEARWKQSLLFRVLDSRYVGNAATALVSNLPVYDTQAVSISDFEPRIASRLGDQSVCRVVVNAAADYRRLLK